MSDEQILRDALGQIARIGRRALQGKPPPDVCGQAAPGVNGLVCVLGPGHAGLCYSTERYSWVTPKTDVLEDETLSSD